MNGRPFTTGTIPYNSTVDVTKGTLLLKTDTGSLTVHGAGGISAVFVLLRGTDHKKPIVELRLTKGNFSVCGKRKTSSARRSRRNDGPPALGERQGALPDTRQILLGHVRAPTG